MELTAARFSRIEPFLPVQRGNVSLSNLQVVNAIQYVAENGCKWRALPRRFFMAFLCFALVVEALR